MSAEQTKTGDRSVPGRRRAALVVPGSAPEKIEKARGVVVDEIIIDLEDAVVPAAKDQAREEVVAAISTGDWVAGSRSVRINGIATGWHDADLEALAGCGDRLTSIVVPKVESAAELASVDEKLSGLGDAGRIGLQGLVETAKGLLALGEIAASCERLHALIIGYADLGASVGRRSDFEHARWGTARDLVLFAARANGIQAIDGPHLGIRVDPGFEQAVEEARRDGFDGKWAIHPGQLASLTEAFTPTEEEVRDARQVIDALRQSEEGGGQGATALNGQMLDEAVRLSALRVLAAAEGDS
jgi:citrate lyase subunit beta / citryl-CoA lyase